MIYYNRYPADYDRDTWALNFLEHGAYTVLLDRYYQADGKLPGDLDSLVRICRANSPIERLALKNVAARFFTVNGDGRLHHKRADVEIELAAKRAEISRQNGRNGGAPVGNQNRKKTTQRVESRLNETTQQATQKQAIQGQGQDLGPQVPPVDPSDLPAPKGGKPKFESPTLEEITKHFLRKGSNAREAMKFAAYYDANGWRVGKNPMKSWHGAAAGWILRAEEK